MITKKNGNTIAKTLLTMSLVFSVSFCYASSKINLDKQTVMCGNYKISIKTTTSDVLKYCDIKKLEKQKYPIHDEQEIVFNAHTTVKMKCEFSNNQVEKCKID